MADTTPAKPVDPAVPAPAAASAAVAPAAAPTEAASAAGAQETKKPIKAKSLLPVLKPREKLVLRIYLLSLALMIVDIVMIRPIGNYLKHLDETIKIQEQVIPRQLMILKHKNRILNDFRAIKPFFVDLALSQEEETAQFLREIEKVSKGANLFVSNINPVKVNKKSDSVYLLSLDLEAKGGLRQVRNFIKTLEDSNSSIRVASFNLKPQGKQADELKVLFTIEKLGVKKNYSTISV